MRTLDLFSGCGGLSLGFQMAGFEIHSAYDFWQAAVNTYQLNFKHPIELADLSSPSVQKQIMKFNYDVIIGGPPCQDFSSAGKRDEGLGRADLSVTFAQIVSMCNPAYFVMENVHRIIKSSKLEVVRDILKDSGYQMYHTILDASYCGVPQSRKRFFLIGAKNLNPVLLDEIIKKKLSSKPLSIKGYMDDEIDFEHYYRHPRSYARRAIFSVFEPSPTIRGVNRPIAKGYPGHPGDPVKITANIRSLTFEERARIQTFPKDFVFWGNKSEKEQQIGNAVPVNLAKFVGNCLMEYHSLISDNYTFIEGAEQFAMEEAPCKF